MKSTIYSAQKGQYAYGQGIGILTLDDFTPYIPGDVGNASSFQFPVLYHQLKGVTVTSATNMEPESFDIILEAARSLVTQGVKAITSNCGYLGFFQTRLAAELPVPVCLSSLLQLPFIKASMSADRKIAVAVARGDNFGPSLLQGVGLTDNYSLEVLGMDKYPHFYDGIMRNSGRLDATAIEEELVEVIRSTVANDPKIGAILLECACLPPYAKAIQDVVNLPIYDFTTMINYMFSARMRHKFTGFM